MRILAQGWTVAGACATTLQRVKRSLNDPTFFRAKDLKLSTTSVRNRLLTAIPTSDAGIRSKISQATTEATLCLTADAGRMVKPMPESTSDISVGISAAV